MKIRSLSSFLILGLVFFTSCSNDDDTTTQVESLDRIWNLSNVSGGFAGVDIDYEDGSVTWEFILENQLLIVTSSLTDDSPQSTFLPLQTGEYDFTTTEFDGRTFLQIEDFGIFNNGDYGRYQILNGELIIDQSEGSEGGAADVFTLSFN